MSIAGVFILVAAIVAIAGAVWLYMQQRAETVLDQRQERGPHFQIQPLSSEECDGFEARWWALQEGFVDDPQSTVAQSDFLVMQVLQARGYPTYDFEEQIADLPVEHAAVVANFRIACEIAVRNEQGLATTEELRRAMQHYRYIFESILNTPVMSQA